jgi:hypothetical protein
MVGYFLAILGKVLREERQALVVVLTRASPPRFQGTGGWLEGG